MAYFLCSSLGFYGKNENGIRFPKEIEDKNQIVTNIKKYLPKMGSAVYVINGWTELPEEESQIRFQTFVEGMKMTGLDFKKFTLLDFKNFNKAKEIIGSADLVYMVGGRIACAMDFYNKMNFSELLKDFKGVVIGISAGAMVQSETIFNFPETFDDTFNPGLCKGLGFEKTMIIIPHFDGEQKIYQGTADRDVVNDYILPSSKNIKMYGFPNGSYALVDNGKTTLHGDVYEIYKGKVKKINKEIELVK